MVDCRRHAHRHLIVEFTFAHAVSKQTEPHPSQNRGPWPAWLLVSGTNHVAMEEVGYRIERASSNHDFLTASACERCSKTIQSARSRISKPDVIGINRITTGTRTGFRMRNCASLKLPCRRVATDGARLRIRRSRFNRVSVLPH
jgi:hypothetical protein